MIIKTISIIHMFADLSTCLCFKFCYTGIVITIYDAVAVLGSRPRDPKTWKFQPHIYATLTRAAELYKDGQTSYIAVSGKWTLNFDVLHITQPFKECDAMANYLKLLGIADDYILREAESKDTISNLYYLKRQIFEPKNLKKLHFITAEGRVTRVKFLCDRILGPDYALSFEGVAHAPEEISANEARTLDKQRAFLAPMKDGDDAWLDNKFYNDPYYKAVKQRVRERAAGEPFIHLADPPWSF